MLLPLPSCQLVGRGQATLAPAHCPRQASRDMLVTGAGCPEALEPAGLRTAGMKAGSSGCVVQPRYKHVSLGARASTGSPGNGTHQLRGADVPLYPHTPSSTHSHAGGTLKPQAPGVPASSTTTAGPSPERDPLWGLRARRLPLAVLSLQV